MYYYKKITDSACKKLNQVITNLYGKTFRESKLVIWLNRMHDVLNLGKYFVIKIEDREIKWISIWKSSPNIYRYSVTNIEGLPIDVFSPSNEIYSVYKQLINCFKDDKDRLQEQESSGTESREGCCIYGRGNRPQLATGRHCNEAQAQGTNDCSQRNQVVVSTRCAEILGSKI